MQPPPFVLNCLGTPRLLTAGGQEVRIKVKKHLAVLVILAVDGGKIRRERLVSMLWPTARPDRARGSVATAISVLRAKLGGDAIEPARDWVQLRKGVLSVDVDRLLRGEAPGDTFTPPISIDAFLKGFQIDEVPEFDDWRDRQHGRLLPLIEKGLVALAEHARRSGDLTALADNADRLLELNDLSEAGITARMQAYALSGDRITAIRLFDEWARRLGEEIQTVPSQSVENLARRLRGKGMESPLLGGVVGAVQTEQWRNQHFVGRSGEYRLLSDQWQAIQRGTGGHVLITGDSGVGKTTLADRFATAVALEGSNVARVRCFDLESGIPFAMIGCIIAALLDRPGAAGTSPEALAELARVLPEIAKRFPGLPRPAESTGGAARLQFAEAAFQLLESVLEERPVLIVIDDYEQSDDVSLSVLHLLIRRLVGKPLMVALTTRAGTMIRRPEAFQLKAGVEEVGLTSMEVQPLNDMESAQLFEVLFAELGLRPTAAERNALAKYAGGFPLAIELIVRDWQVHGESSTAFAIDAITREVQAFPEERYRRLTESLLTDLNETERLVVHMAAVLDRRVGEIALYKVAGLPHVTILATLARMLDRRALRDTSAGLEWINPSVRAHVYLAVPPSIRRALHEGVLDSLVSKTNIGPKVPGLELAWHSIRANRIADASLFLLTGAREALHTGAAREAELALLSGMHAFEEPVRIDATLLLAEVWIELGDRAKAIDLLRPLVEAPSSRTATATLLHLKGILPLLEESDGAPNQLEAATERLFTIASSSADLTTKAKAASLGAAMYRGLSPSPRSSEFLRLGADLPIDDLDPADAVDLLSSLAKQYYYSRDLVPCESLLRRALQIANQCGLRNADYLSVINGFSAVACARGDYNTGLQHSLELCRAANTIGIRRYSSLGAGNAALCAFRLGDYAAALKWAREAQGESLQGAYEGGLNGLQLAGLSHAMLGDMSEAVSLAERSLELADSARTNVNRRRSLGTAIDILLVADQIRRAKEIGRRFLTFGSPLEDDPGRTGQFLRWKGSLVEGSMEIAELAAELRQARKAPLDELDQVEVLWTMRAFGLFQGADEAQLRSREENLPPATLEQLRVLARLLPNRNSWLEARAETNSRSLVPAPA